MAQDYRMSYFGAETEVEGVQIRKPYMNIVGLKGDPNDSQNITSGFFGSGDGAIPDGTDLFEVLYFSFGVGVDSGYGNNSGLTMAWPKLNKNNLFDPSASLPKGISDLAKNRSGNMLTNNFIVQKYVDSHSTNLTKALMRGKGFKAAQIYFLQAGNEDTPTGFVANRFVFIDVWLTDIYLGTAPVAGDTATLIEPTNGPGDTQGIMGGGKDAKSVCEVLSFQAQHVWIYSYFYKEDGTITTICKGR